MTQHAFDFTAPIAPSSSPLARHCSQQGAQSAQERIGRQCLALITLYRQRGPQTDVEAATALGIERTSICARRNELRRRGLVEAVATKRNEETGISNTTWGLSSSR